MSSTYFGFFDITHQTAATDITITISNLKIEKGTQVTGWTPAPEDNFRQGTAGITIESTKLYQGTSGTHNDSGTGFYLDSDGKFSLKDKLSFDGANLSVSGAITATSGTFTGTVNASAGAFTGNVSTNSAFTAGSKAGIDGAGSGDTTVRIFAGDTLANKATAPFRVQQGGKVVATNAEVLGDISADSLTLSSPFETVDLTAARLADSSLTPDMMSEEAFKSIQDNISDMVGFPKGDSEVRPLANDANFGVYGGLKLAHNSSGFQSSLEITDFNHAEIDPKLVCFTAFSFTSPHAFSNWTANEKIFEYEVYYKIGNLGTTTLLGTATTTLTEYMINPNIGDATNPYRYFGLVQHDFVHDVDAADNNKDITYTFKITNGPSFFEDAAEGEFNLKVTALERASGSVAILESDGSLNIETSSLSTTTLLSLRQQKTTDISGPVKMFIEGRVTDDDTNEIPQGKIGFETNFSSLNDQTGEGDGAFVVYTNNSGGTTASPSNLTEKFRVNHFGGARIGEQVGSEVDPEGLKIVIQRSGVNNSGTLTTVAPTILDLVENDTDGDFSGWSAHSLGIDFRLMKSNGFPTSGASARIEAKHVAENAKAQLVFKTSNHISGSSTGTALTLTEDQYILGGGYTAKVANAGSAKLQINSDIWASGTFKTTNWALPSADGSAGQVLVTDGSGTISWGGKIDVGNIGNDWTGNGSVGSNDYVQHFDGARGTTAMRVPQVGTHGTGLFINSRNGLEEDANITDANGTGAIVLGGGAGSAGGDYFSHAINMAGGKVNIIIAGPSSDNDGSTISDGSFHIAHTGVDGSDDATDLFTIYTHLDQTSILTAETVVNALEADSLSFSGRDVSFDNDDDGSISSSEAGIYGIGYRPNIDSEPPHIKNDGTDGGTSGVYFRVNNPYTDFLGNTDHKGSIDITLDIDDDDYIETGITLLDSGIYNYAQAHNFYTSRTRRMTISGSQTHVYNDLVANDDFEARKYIKFTRDIDFDFDDDQSGSTPDIADTLQSYKLAKSMVLPDINYDGTYAGINFLTAGGIAIHTNSVVSGTNVSYDTHRCGTAYHISGIRHHVPTESAASFIIKGIDDTDSTVVADNPTLFTVDTVNDKFKFDHLDFVVEGDTLYVDISEDKVGINDSTPSYSLDVTGTIRATGNVIAYSDERLKSDIKTLDGKKVLDMRGVEFTKDGEKSSGVIAQEIEKIAPELVMDDGEYKSVAYGNLVGYLIEAVKDLQQQVDELKKK
jgi:hypothetical protein